MVSEGITDPKLKRSLLDGQASDDENSRNKAFLMGLHHFNYLAPSPKTTTYGKRWTPSIEQSKLSFFQAVRNVDQIKDKMAKRQQFCDQHEIKYHPIIFEASGYFFVAIGNQHYECDSSIDALDALLKIYDVLNIPFPAECSKVLQLLQHIFFCSNSK
ncbi:hypothetical protein Bhyg_03219 [Pseudolycoriella hygida]|uniref:Uncharacterized protein n=1 Tax=Pseudolycoriella hygida TaxID=35572 RepID=A0A9Q0S7B7_9DIPT|nr:hypothetical protein Bhyg_03219 [Pseudolycoriella hygida]